MDNAKLFIDFILSEEVQNIWGSTLTNRPVMKDAATNDAMTPMADINVIEEDIPYVSATSRSWWTSTLRSSPICRASNSKGSRRLV